MKILAIETSCDETAAAIISKSPKNNYVAILSNIVASSLLLHSKTGGIVPEIAAREQVRLVIPVVEKAIKESKISTEDIDATAVTVGPGLIGSLLVGIETAKTLAYLWKKPIIPVNHLLGHIYANFISTLASQLSTFNFPAIALIVSGGHTDLVLMKGHKKIKWIGGTLDDAAGEAFDKIGRLLGLPYPGGPAIENAAKNGNPKAFNFPRPMIGSNDLDFSFSGLKTAVLRQIKTIRQLDNETISNLCASVQQVIADVLVSKTLNAAQKYKVKSILLGGGVAANQKLKEEMLSQLSTLAIQLYVPPTHLCTDNAAMIGVYAAFHSKPLELKKITANPELYF